MARARSRSARSVALRIAAVGCGLLIAVALLEVGLRLLARATPARPALEIRPAGSTPKLDRRGPEGRPERRILVIGDSFTFGHGVAADAAYPMRLAEILRADDRALEVLSISLSGWNTRLEARALPDYLQAFPADVVIVGYCLNDAERLATSAMLEMNPHLRRRASRLPAGLGRKSLLFARIESALETLRLRPALRAYYRSLYEDPEWKRPLARLARAARAHGARPVLVIFPIFDSPLDRRYAYEGLHEEVAAAAAREGFRVLDLLPAYRRSGRSGRELALVPYTDPHPSPLAHGIAAEEIARFLRSAER